MFQVTFKLLTRNISPSSRVHLLSATLQTEAIERIQSFRTNEANVKNHEQAQVGQFYKISPEIKKQLFLHGGLPKSYEEQTKTFTETCLMIREPSLDVMNCLKAIDYNKPTIRFVLYGQKGSGKSLCLAHVVQYGLQEGFLIVHVPWVGSWMRRCKEYSNSETRENFVDINLDAAAWLVHFKTQNAHLLNDPELKISKEYVWSKRESTLKDAPLIDLVEHGINRVKFASDTIVALADEIKTLSMNNKCKTLVAIDGYNAFFYPHTRVYTEKKEVVHPHKVTITQAFLNLTKSNWHNSVAVVTVDEIAIAQKDQISYMPKYLLGKDGFEHLDPFVPVPVHGYSKKELTSCMDYYRERKWVQETPGQDNELEFLSGSNPYKLMKICAAL